MSSCTTIDRANTQEASLDEEVPDAGRLVDVDLDKLARLTPTQLPATPCVLTHEGLLNDEVGLGENAKLGAECLLLRCEQVQERAVCEVERRSWTQGGGKNPELL